MDFLRMLLVASTLVCVPVAHASLIFSFSFDNDVGAGGNTAGPITGEIHLADTGAPQKATKVVITGIGSHFPQFGHLPLPFVVIENETAQDGWLVGNNSFAVKGSSVDLWNFDAFHNHLAAIVFEQLQLGSTGALLPVFAVGVLDAQSRLSLRLTNSSDNPEFVLLQQAPAPSVLFLLGIGFVGLYCSRRRKPVAGFRRMLVRSRRA